MTWIAFGFGVVLGFPAGVILVGALATGARTEAEQNAEAEGFLRGWRERGQLARIDRDLAEEVRRVREKDEGRRLLEEIAEGLELAHRAESR